VSIQATHNHPSVHQAQTNRQPPPAPPQSNPSSAVPQDKVTLSSEAKAKAAAMGTHHHGDSK